MVLISLNGVNQLSDSGFAICSLILVNDTLGNSFVEQTACRLCFLLS